MELGDVLRGLDRAGWRRWLEAHHDRRTEVWLALPKSTRDRTAPLMYLEAVLEALCFGWVDGLGKTLDETHVAQRFTPRKQKSRWTELNKERARRLIAAGRMTDAGRRVLPDLDPARFQIPPDILAALQADGDTWRNFQGFPALYQRVRVGYVDELPRRAPEFQTRLRNLVERTRRNETFGNWDDSALQR